MDGLLFFCGGKPLWWTAARRGDRVEFDADSRGASRIDGLTDSGPGEARAADAPDVISVIGPLAAVPRHVACQHDLERKSMPKASKHTAPKLEDSELVESRAQDLGGYRVEFASFRKQLDTEPFLKGLPGDSCQCPHWGYVARGKITFRFADHDEVYEAGDAYYAPPGHRPLVDAGSEMIEFSPTEDFKRTIETIMRNGAAVQPSE